MAPLFMVISEVLSLLLAGRDRISYRGPRAAGRPAARVLERLSTPVRSWAALRGCLEMLRYAVSATRDSGAFLAAEREDGER